MHLRSSKDDLFCTTARKARLRSHLTTEAKLNSAKVALPSTPPRQPAAQQAMKEQDHTRARCLENEQRGKTVTINGGTK